MTETLKVPGATLHYDVSGTGPVLLCIPGGPADAGAFDSVKDLLAAHYTVVTYDPRGLSRSTFDDEPQDTGIGEFAEDAHLLLAALGDEPAYVFGSSGGGLVGLELAARYPGQVRKVFAHEPPATYLLPEHDPAFTQEVYDTYRAEGVMAAMGKFVASAGLENTAPPPGEPSPEAQAALGRNMDFFLGHMWLPIGRHTVDTAKLAGQPLVIGIGETAKGQLAYRAAVALAEQLGVEPVVFAGDHAGFGGHSGEFTEQLHAVLTNP
ncbi:alpha/beta fold hydrolase [Amycolatopsis sp. NPDC059657]|uniref:alpha/beta fold hydrolase n=1 Tax=Amycolatopsis sp. NPDC059657 TaxID=3346899 RepID=UPI00366A9BDD